MSTTLYEAHFLQNGVERRSILSAQSLSSVLRWLASTQRCEIIHAVRIDQSYKPAAPCVKCGAQVEMSGDLTDGSVFYGTCTSCRCVARRKLHIQHIDNSWHSVDDSAFHYPTTAHADLPGPLDYAARVGLDPHEIYYSCPICDGENCIPFSSQHSWPICRCCKQRHPVPSHSYTWNERMVMAKSRRAAIAKERQIERQRAEEALARQQELARQRDERRAREAAASKREQERLEEEARAREERRIREEVKRLQEQEQATEADFWNAFESWLGDCPELTGFTSVRIDGHSFTYRKQILQALEMLPTGAAEAAIFLGQGITSNDQMPDRHEAIRMGAGASLIVFHRRGISRRSAGAQELASELFRDYGIDILELGTSIGRWQLRHNENIQNFTESALGIGAVAGAVLLGLFGG